MPVQTPVFNIGQDLPGAIPDFKWKTLDVTNVGDETPNPINTSIVLNKSVTNNKIKLYLGLMVPNAAGNGSQIVGTINFILKSQPLFSIPFLVGTTPQDFSTDAQAQKQFYNTAVVQPPLGNPKETVYFNFGFGTSIFPQTSTLSASSRDAMNMAFGVKTGGNYSFPLIPNYFDVEGCDTISINPLCSASVSPTSPNYYAVLFAAIYADQGE